MASCEYSPLGENFIERATPDTNIPVLITLNDVNPADTIYVYQTTQVNVNIKSTKGLLNADVKLNDQYYAYMNSNSTSFNLNCDLSALVS